MCRKCGNGSAQLCPRIKERVAKIVAAGKMRMRRRSETYFLRRRAKVRDKHVL